MLETCWQLPEKERWYRHTVRKEVQQQVRKQPQNFGNSQTTETNEKHIKYLFKYAFCNFLTKIVLKTWLELALSILTLINGDVKCKAEFWQKVPSIVVLLVNCPQILNFFSLFCDHFIIYHYLCIQNLTILNENILITHKSSSM